MGLICCVPQTLVSHPHLEINEGTVWGPLPTVILVKPHNPGSFYKKGILRLKKVK